MQERSVSRFLACPVQDCLEQAEAPVREIGPRIKRSDSEAALSFIFAGSICTVSKTPTRLSAHPEPEWPVLCLTSAKSLRGVPKILLRIPSKP
jgi:hypothetical protein